MDNVVTKAKERLAVLGLDQAKIDETINLLYEELLEDIVFELASTLTDEEVQEYKKRIEEAKSAEHLQTLIQEMSAKAFGENHVEELTKRFNEKIEKVEKLSVDIKGLLEKYQEGDPETVKILEDTANSDDLI